MKTAIVDTACANLPSVEAALRRVGLQPSLAEQPEETLEAPFAVLPGVGSFGAAAGQLRAQKMEDALIRRVELGRPTLAICVGLQLLAESSEETPGTAGTGIVPARVTRFRPGARVPHMGWNLVTGNWLEKGYAYFANSFRIGENETAELEAAGWEVAWSDHDGRFVAALRRGGVLACQFHPELSGAWGEDLLRAWARQEVAPC